jgi:hypothetical protein
MSYNYSTWLNYMGAELVVSTTDVNFQIVVPWIIDDAEQRIYRDVDLLNTVVTDTSGSFTAGLRTFNLPSSNGTFFVVESIYAISPVGTPIDQGIRNELVPASRPFINTLFPSSTGSGIPSYFAPTTQSAFIVGPWPDQAYQAEVVGTIRPTPLSTTNVTTILTVYLPDLFFAASMVAGAAYQQNFAATADNPQMAVTWEGHYQTLLKSAQTEEARKKFTSEGWSSKTPAPLATPPRV